jgi:hypothetical protein
MSTGNDPVERSEYEQFVHTYEVRHAELRLELKESEVELKGQMNDMIGKMDTLTTQINRRSLDVWKLVSTSAVSIIAGYILGYVQHLIK